MTNDPALCARCAAHQLTCCQTSEIAVTLGDVRRIAEHIGTADSSDLYEFRAPSDPVYLHHPDDPIWLETVIRPDGTRRVLKRQQNGDCRFLATSGCVLPIEVRPLICRIYPYDYNEQGLMERLASGCPLQLLREDETLLGALDMRRGDAERWHAQLYSEIRQEPHYLLKQDL
jgi:uncharacterized protein